MLVPLLLPPGMGLSRTEQIRVVRSVHVGADDVDCSGTKDNDLFDAEVFSLVTLRPVQPTVVRLLNVTRAHADNLAFTETRITHYCPCHSPII